MSIRRSSSNPLRTSGGGSGSRFNISPRRVGIQIVEDQKGIRSNVTANFLLVRSIHDKKLEKERLMADRKRERERKANLAGAREREKAAIADAKNRHSNKIDAMIERYRSNGGVPDAISIIYDSGIMITVDHKVLMNGEVQQEFTSARKAQEWVRDAPLTEVDPHIRNYGKIKIYTKAKGFHKPAR